MRASASPFAIDTLHRHTERRRQGIPTVSVLVGQPEHALELWREAIGNNAAAVLVVHDPEISSLVARWLAFVDQQCDVSAAWLRSVRGAVAPGTRNPDVLFEHKLSREIAIALDGAFPDEPPPHPAWLVRALALRQAAAPDERHFLSRIGQDYTGPAIHLVTSVCGLLSPEIGPGILLTGGSANGGAAWLAVGAESFVQLAAAVPALPLAISIDGPTIDSYLTDCRPTRTGAMLHEGLIDLDPQPAGQVTIAAARPAAGAPDNANAVLAPALLDPDPIPDQPDRAVGGPAPPPRSREDDDRARSAAERRLFEQLRAVPETAGLFTLNEIVAAAGFHAQKAEIDLCSTALRIAIEIDGYYHFGEPEAYRRDRRKDWALQQEGYVVLRFLADDVLEQMEAVLERIVSAVRRQRNFLPSRGI
jgi:hypothetical protein